jgi:hypothetical protein
MRPTPRPGRQAAKPTFLGASKPCCRGRSLAPDRRTPGRRHQVRFASLRDGRVRPHLTPTAWCFGMGLCKGSGRSRKHGLGDRLGTTRHARPRTTLPPWHVGDTHERQLTCGNAYSAILGVKGSQVQILSARRSYRSPLTWCLSRSEGFVVYESDPVQDPRRLTAWDPFGTRHSGTPLLGHQLIAVSHPAVRAVSSGGF